MSADDKVATKNSDTADEGVKYHAEQPRQENANAEAQQQVYDAMKGMVEEAGIEVIEVDRSEAQAMLGNKESPDTGKATQMSAEVPAISSDDVANIQQNLVTFKDNLDKYLQASKNHRSRAFRGQLAETLGIPERGQSSHYARIESNYITA